MKYKANFQIGLKGLSYTYAAGFREVTNALISDVVSNLRSSRNNLRQYTILIFILALSTNLNCNILYKVWPTMKNKSLHFGKQF